MKEKAKPVVKQERKAQGSCWKIARLHKKK